ncbi:hypothetical protein MLD38_010479 [Melastoma candidum]|nr:hypothetical protein MLD38_010479 [Melastoma candidum]
MGGDAGTSGGDSQGRDSTGYGASVSESSAAAGASASAGNTFNELQQHEGFAYEEELFNMPNLLTDMAGGMMISLPSINSPPSDDSPSSSDVENLWSYP